MADCRAGHVAVGRAACVGIATARIAAKGAVGLAVGQAAPVIGCHAGRVAVGRAARVATATARAATARVGAQTRPPAATRLSSWRSPRNQENSSASNSNLDSDGEETEHVCR